MAWRYGGWYDACVCDSFTFSVYSKVTRRIVRDNNAASIKISRDIHQPIVKILCDDLSQRSITSISRDIVSFHRFHPLFPVTSARHARRSRHTPIDREIDRSHLRLSAPKSESKSTGESVNSKQRRAISSACYQPRRFGSRARFKSRVHRSVSAAFRRSGGDARACGSTGQARRFTRGTAVSRHSVRSAGEIAGKQDGARLFADTSAVDINTRVRKKEKTVPRNVYERSVGRV